MACDTELIDYICQTVEPIGFVRPKKMFGEWMIYIDEKPLILVCDNTPYIKMLPEIESLMTGAEVGCPYPGAKPHYILDIEHCQEALKVLQLMLPLIPYPQKKSKKRQ